MCTHCKDQVTTSGNGNLVQLTSKYREINTELEKIHAKRNRRKAKMALDLNESPKYHLAD